CGPNQALVFGNVAPSAGLAVIDQSDAWAMARVEGVGARDVLARLTPLDLRPSTFAAGQTARTMIGHMTGQVTALGPETYELMVFRSMAGTLVHDLKRAMGFVAGRSKLG
ncbi:MAG: sarcosine oxidase subunit gamma family protein, partial [Pseudomonadota bacterium]